MFSQIRLDQHQPYYSNSDRREYTCSRVILVLRTNNQYEAMLVRYTKVYGDAGIQIYYLCTKIRV